MEILQALLGLIVFCLVAWVFSENRRILDWRVIGFGLGLQFVLAVALLKIPFIRAVFIGLNDAVLALAEATQAGASIVFGFLGGHPQLGQAPFELKEGLQFTAPLAFSALPLVMVIGALTSLLFYWKVMPYVVRGLSWVLQRTLGIGGALGVGTAANIFVGMVEGPLFIRPYMAKLTRSELFAVMVVGMATIAGTMMAVYASILQPVLGREALGHLLVASFISAPAALVMARIMVPETAQPTMGELSDPHPANGAMDSITYGAMEGLKLWLNIIALLIVLIALVNLANMALAGISGWILGPEAAPITLEGLLGYVMLPFVWLMGVPASEAHAAGQLMGVKVVINEFVSYLQLAGMAGGEEPVLSQRTTLIMTYAMCGFANLGSLGIMLGGLGAMAPERREEISKLGLRSILAGVLATMMTGAIAGLIA